MQFKQLVTPLLCCSLAALAGCSSGGGSGGGFGSLALSEDEGLNPAESAAASASTVSEEPGVIAAPDAPAPDKSAESTTSGDSTDPLLQDPFDDAIGAGSAFAVPATAVDCADTLPCRWRSESGSFAITITRADNTASLDRLAVLYRIDVLHDTSVLLSNSLDAHGASGQRFKPIRQNLGDSNGASPVALLAGDSATGTLTFDKTAKDASLSYFNLAMIDNGLPYSAEFTALPTGSASSETADCAGTLPCTWTSGNGDISVTLVAAGGYDVNNRLGVNFLVESVDDDQVVLDAGSIAIGNDGTPIDALNHRFGNEQAIEAISHKLFDGVALAGQVSFYRSASRPASLVQLELSLYRDSPEPRWNPRFRTIPLQ